MKRKQSISTRATHWARPLAALPCLLTGCEEHSDPQLDRPTVSIIRGDGTTAPAPLCHANKAGDNGDDVRPLYLAYANGVDEITLVVDSTWPRSGDESYDVDVRLHDEHLSILPWSAGAPASDDASATSNTTSKAGDSEAYATLSPVSPRFSLRLRAGLDAGTAVVEVDDRTESTLYCLPLDVSSPTSMELSIGNPISAASFPAGWTVFSTEVTLSADRGSISNGFGVAWSSTDCSYFAASCTRTFGGPTVTNQLYVPPGWSQTKITVSAGDKSIQRSFCLTPGGVASASDGPCPALRPPDSRASDNLDAGASEVFADAVDPDAASMDDVADASDEGGLEEDTGLYVCPPPASDAQQDAPMNECPAWPNAQAIP